MDSSNYYVKLNANGHSSVYRNGHIVLGSEVVEVEHHDQKLQEHPQDTAIVMLASGKLLEGVKVVN
ncbi:hypothetical protein [Vibrio maritimus]|uniref:Uncharacterized protein n=1 Tax=Vibrio variabilis TaxID=990271 RepID=A0ABQ0JLM1_9VIBR|nr:hypothetical protein [Vibrio maritimus]GAL29649.1 hypothetical protein JCM19239_2577 [Vibrio variabilis]